MEYTHICNVFLNEDGILTCKSFSALLMVPTVRGTLVWDCAASCSISVWRIHRFPETPLLDPLQVAQPLIWIFHIGQKCEFGTARDIRKVHNACPTLIPSFPFIFHLCHIITTPENTFECIMYQFEYF